MERVDSDRTDESPFGSTLTTPVDEDVILFHGIEQRLIGKSHISCDDVKKEHTVIPNEGDGDALFKSLNHDYTKPIEDTTIQSALTSLSIVERPSAISDAQFPASDAVKRHVTRPRARSIFVAGQKPLQADAASVPTYVHSLSATSNVDLTNALGNAEVLSQGTGKTTFEVKTIPREAALSEGKLTSNLKPENGKLNQGSAETAKELLTLLPFAQQSPALDLCATESLISFEQLSSGSLFLCALRALVFLPWCVIAGATILVFPNHLETILFGLGLFASPQGIHRFAFLTEISKELVSTFIASLIVLWCLYPTIGYLLIGATVARFLYTWQGFKPNRKIRLGEDDMQSLYYVSRHYIFGDDALISLREEDDGFYL